MNIFLAKMNSYCQVTRPASAPSSSKDKNEEETSAGFVTVLPEIIRQFPKTGLKKITLMHVNSSLPVHYTAPTD
jgi:hypothetical protein